MGRPRITKSGKCVTKTDFNHIATLPKNCRPNKRLVFNLNNHEKTSRVDVLSNGVVKWVDGGNSHNWLSLTGITFATKRKINCDVRWSNGGPAWTTCVKVAPYNTVCMWVKKVGCRPRITKSGKCVTKTDFNHIATLPKNCRPNKRLVFNLNNHEKTSRVD